MSHATELREIHTSQTVKVDRERGVLKGVKVIGFESANGRSYPRATLEKARGLYEGARVNVDHLDKNGKSDRSVADRFGRLTNVAMTQEGLFADLEYLKTHPLAETTAEVAERMPEMLGLSHNAEGRVRFDKGRAIVDEIIRVRSVDLVSDPATTKGLFESEDPMSKGREQATLAAKELIERLEKDAPTDPWVKSLREMMDAGAVVADMPVTHPADGTTNEQIKAAFRAMVVAAFDDQMLDAKATLEKIKAIIQAQDKLMGSVKKPAERGTPAQGPEDTPTPESDQTKPNAELVALQEKVRLMEAEKDARKLLGIAKIEATDDLVEALALLPTTEHRKKLIESLPKGAAEKTPAPRSTPPKGTKLTESKAPVDTNDLAKTAAYLRSR